MAIEPMRTFSLYAPLSVRDALLPRLQRFENVHFKQTDAGDAPFLKAAYAPEDAAASEEALSKVRYALAKLNPYIEKPKGLQAMTAPSPTLDWSDFERYPERSGWEDVYSRVFGACERLAALGAERERLVSENAQLAAWLGLDVSLESLRDLKMVKALFCAVHKNGADAFRANLTAAHPDCYAEKAADTRDGAVFVVLVKAADADALSDWAKANGGALQAPAFSGVPSETVRANADKIKTIDADAAALKSTLAELARQSGTLKTVADCLETRLARVGARKYFMQSESVLVLEGWLPAREAAAFRALVADVCGDAYYLEEADAPREGDVPVKLRNNPVISAFEAVTIMYSVPKYTQLDPTPIHAPFYMLFFAAMIGDAGFGLILLAASSLALKFFNLKKGTRNFMRFFFWLSIPTILIGCLYGSLFGFTFFTPVPTADGGFKAVIDTGSDITLMIIASIVIGTVHVIFGLLVKGYMLLRDGHPFAALFDSVLWIAAVLSAIGVVLALAGVAPGAKTACLWVMVVSLVGLAATQGRDAASVGGKIGTGLYAVYGITGYVGDLVSYTRLMALSLSGAYIGYSFIKIAELFSGPLYWTCGVLIIVAGQTLNLGLGALGAYVHSCRLQFVEFFSKFYEGGGVAFKPFKPMNTYIKINDN